MRSHSGAWAQRPLAAAVAGTVTLPVIAVFGLEEAAEAHRLMVPRASTGKLLLRVSAEPR